MTSWPMTLSLADQATGAAAGFDQPLTTRANPVDAIIGGRVTAAILRLSDGLIEHLVLGDPAFVPDRAAGAPYVVSDPREVIRRRRICRVLRMRVVPLVVAVRAGGMLRTPG